MEKHYLGWERSDDLVVCFTLKALSEPEIEEEETTKIIFNNSITEKAGKHGIIPIDTASSS